MVVAVNSGKITLEQACEIYQLSEEELLSWKHSFETHGLAGLRTTRIQQYRRGRLIWCRLLSAYVPTRD